MRHIKQLAEEIEEEVEGAKKYAERSVEFKVKGEMNKANRYKEMAMDELKHCSYLHEFAVAEIEAVSKVYTPPIEMQEAWEKAHKRYVEQVAWVRQMLSM